MSVINLAIVGRNEIVREGLRRILTENDFVVRASVAHCTELTAQVDSLGVLQLIIVDTTSDDQGLESCLMLRDRFPATRMVLVAENCAIGAITRALAAGADGYLFKAIASEPLVSALRLVALGEKIVPSQTITDMIEHQYRDLVVEKRIDHDVANLSEREIEILGCLVEGDANKLISRRLMIAEATVKVHIKAILRKLNVSNRTQAAIWAVNRDIVGRGCASRSSKHVVSSSVSQMAHAQ